ncbi:ribonuclease HII [archaeon CG_4_10_14_0_2_um_filter_Archaea_38_6]|nr:MAG: ribonuclease HII [archaeon CG07_land_8_20_14_0_80_38_8]PIU88448.1 MAG: ribonuclease HII [archaeon CG06_land_8_20_14_3_00_37_11]PJA23175.1 MAG: ribonuclease HII [archaeon CG_4_10_14_0_2_um_filter_Archaea_38_6]
MVKICGIDEAGKGPVIGDLVIAGCLIEDDDSVIKELGVKDSKLLTPEERFELFSKIKDNSYSYDIVRVSAMEIDERNKVGCNLNKLECLKMAQIINNLKPDKVIIDCPHPVPEKFKRELIAFLNDKSVEIIAEHKADYNYALVGAASILAKVTRDAHIRELSKALNLDIGSGYCSDPLTKKLMKDYFNNNLSQLKPFIRHSWDTYKRGKSEKEQKGLFDCL